jgi:hypothetical protein
MKNISYFLWLIEQASGGLFYIWPITIGLLLLTFSIFVSTLKSKKEVFKKNLKFIPLPLFGPALILFFGTIFVEKPNFTFVAYSALGVTALLAGFSIYKAIGNRLFTVASLLLIKTAGSGIHY